MQHVNFYISYLYFITFKEEITMLKAQADIANTISIFMNVDKDCKDNMY